MNPKLLLKTIFLIIVIVLLVMIGMNNRGTVPFSLPPLLSQTFKLPAALMYIGFFAIGLLTGTILTASTDQKGSSGPSKPSKAGK